MTGLAPTADVPSGCGATQRAAALDFLARAASARRVASRGRRSGCSVARGDMLGDSSTEFAVASGQLRAVFCPERLV